MVQVECLKTRTFQVASRWNLEQKAFQEVAATESGGVYGLDAGIPTYNRDRHYQYNHEFSRKFYGVRV